LQNTSFLKTPWAKAGIFVGDASFTLYLVHPIVIDVFEFIVAKIRLAPIMAVPLMVLTIAACIAAALLFYRFAELPYREWARRLHRSAKPTAVAQSTTA
jgi:peptidoglycan/LPS O-acetylase OafA/YrhL